MNYNEWKEFNDYEDGRWLDDNTEECGSDLVEVRDDGALLAAREKYGTSIDKIVTLPTYEFGPIIENYNFDVFHQEVIYCMENGIGTRTPKQGSYQRRNKNLI